VKDREIGLNEMCPCGRGQPYGSCCQRRGRVKWLRTATGDLVKEVQIPEETASLLQGWLEKIEGEHGGAIPDEAPLFPEGMQKDPAEIEREVVDLLRQAGVNPMFVYAFQKTGMLLSEDNIDIVSADAINQWNAAIAEYQAMQN